jgi:HSP20 family protein
MANISFEKLPLFRPWSDILENDRKAPAINIAESEKGFTIEVVAPGFLKTDFTVSLENDQLKISGESQTETTGEEKNYYRKEYSRSSFSRSFTLPDNVQADAIQAQYQDGILTIELPRIPAATAKTPTSITVQ